MNQFPSHFPDTPHNALGMSQDVMGGVQGNIENVLRFDPEAFLSFIGDLEEEALIAYLKSEKMIGLQDKTFRTYRYLMQTWARQFVKIWPDCAEGVNHFLGNFTQRISYFALDNDEGCIKAVRVLRLFVALSQYGNIKYIFQRSQEWYAQKDYGTEPWVDACEIDLGLTC